MRPFDNREYADRVGRMKRKMEEIGVDVLLVASPANQNYLTGYDGWSFYTPQMVVVAKEHEYPIWFGRGLDAGGARITVYMDDDHVIGYPDEYVASSERHPMQYLAKIMTDRGWHRGRIGVEMEEYYYTARWHDVLTASLPDATFVDAFLAVNWVRMRKSSQEIEYLMQAGQIAAAAMQAAADSARPGVRQCDVMAEVYRVTTGGTPEVGGTFTCKPPNAMVGELCQGPHLSWTDDPLVVDEMFFIELGGCRHRYHAPLSRCIYIGKPTQPMLDLAEVIAEGLNAVLDAAKPGVVCEELESVWRGVTARHGIDKESRIGYPVGIGYPPTWGELTCSLRKGDRTVLEPNMTFHCVPAVWMDDYSLIISESFAITDAGAKTFADYPRKLLSGVGS